MPSYAIPNEVNQGPTTICNLYRMRSNADEIASLFGAVNEAGNIPSSDGIYPDQDAPIVRQGDAARRIETHSWWFPPPGKVKRPVTNVRNLDSPFWRASLVNPERRCLVPVTSFCEWEGAPGSKHKVWFDFPDHPLFAFAGIWRPVDGERSRFAFLTCEPNELVAPVHPKAMPVLLTAKDADTWLTADWDDARQLARPFPATDMRLSREDGDLLL
ncbi:MAG: SOS response-associated peptidase [Pacificimonas sp.]